MVRFEWVISVTEIKDRISPWRWKITCVKIHRGVQGTDLPVFKSDKYVEEGQSPNKKQAFKDALSALESYEIVSVLDEYERR